MHRRQFLAAVSISASFLIQSQSLTKAEGGVVGITLEDAIVASVRAQKQLERISTQAAEWGQGFSVDVADPAVCRACRLDQEALVRIAEEAQQISRELQESLPAVGAAAAYATKDWRLLFRKSTFDPVVGVYALLDRADGSSTDGPNQNISIADIERLERLEADTQEAIDRARAVADIARELVMYNLPAEDDKAAQANLKQLSIQSRRAGFKVSSIVSEVPKRELAKIVAAAGLQKGSR